MSISKLKESKSTDIDRKNINTGLITDLNIVVANMKMSGMSNPEIAEELGVSSSAISQHLKRFKDLVSIDEKDKSLDPINNERARLAKKFNKINRVSDHILKAGSKATETKKEIPGWKTDFQRLKLAKDLGIDILKGSGVLRERTETPPESLEEKRLTVVHKLELAQQYGVEIPQDITADVEITTTDTPKCEVDAT